MALSITPAVSGAQRRWWRDLSLYWSGTVLGGLASLGLAAAAVALGTAVAGRTPTLISACALAGLALLREAGLAVPLPYRRRQVPSTWRDELPSAEMSFLYGLSLGTGFLTLFTSSTHLTFVVLAPFAPWPVVIAAVLLYGVGKALVVLVGTGTTTHEQVLRRVLESDRAPSLVVIRRALGVTCTALMIASTMLSTKGV
jgi:hypothetical protein